MLLLNLLMVCLLTLGLIRGAAGVSCSDVDSNGHATSPGTVTYIGVVSLTPRCSPLCAPLALVGSSAAFEAPSA